MQQYNQQNYFFSTSFLSKQQQQEQQGNSINSKQYGNQVKNNSLNSNSEQSHQIQNNVNLDVNINEGNISQKKAYLKQNQTNFFDISASKQRTNYSRSMTDNFSNSNSKLIKQLSVKEESPSKQPQINSFSSSFNPSQKNQFVQSLSQNLNQNERNIKNISQNNQKSQHYFQIQNSQGECKQNIINSKEQQSSLPQNSLELSASTSIKLQQQSDIEQNMDQSEQNQSSNQKLINKPQVKKNTNSSNNYYFSSSMSYINEFTQNNNQNSSQLNNSYNIIKSGGLYNPYSLKKLTPTKMRQNHSSSLRNGLNIETNNLNYGNHSSPYINSLSASNISSGRGNNNPQHNSHSSTSRNPYYIGLYSNKNISKPKDLSIIRQQVKDTLNIQSQQQQNDSQILSEFKKDQRSFTNSGLETSSSSITNSQNLATQISANDRSQYSNNKSKSPKLTSASFAQLKSPISQNKVFLSPQSKFTIGFNSIINTTSATSRKQSNGNNNIFSNSNSHQHINSSHSASRVLASNSSGSINKILSTSTQELPTSQIKANSINLLNQAAGNQSNSKNQTPKKIKENSQNLSNYPVQNQSNDSFLNKSNNNIQDTSSRSIQMHNNININKTSNEDQNQNQNENIQQQNNTPNTPNNSNKNNISNKIDSKTQNPFQDCVQNQNNSCSSAQKNPQKTQLNSQLPLNKINHIERENFDLNNLQKNITAFLNKSNNQQKMQQQTQDNIKYEASNYASLPNSIIELIQTTQIPNHEKTKYSVKRNGIVKSYGANTNQGLIRNYNEDRVSIILNIMKPQGKVTENHMQWPKCSFFGVYDGHGGVACADFLRDHLHQFVIKDSNFPKNPKQAILNGFEAAESEFLKLAQQKEGTVEKSGSCAIVVMIVGTRCYVANVGDSRAIMSGFGGTRSYDLSRDHKPLDSIEQKRIEEAGGKIYQQITLFLKAFIQNHYYVQLHSPNKQKQYT